MPVVVLRRATPQANPLHEASAADSLQTRRKVPAYGLQDGMPLPDRCQRNPIGTAKNKVRSRLADAAQRVRAVMEDAENSFDAANRTPTSAFAKQPAQGSEGRRVMKQDGDTAAGGRLPFQPRTQLYHFPHRQRFLGAVQEGTALGRLEEVEFDRARPQSFGQQDDLRHLLHIAPDQGEDKLRLQAGLHQLLQPLDGRLKAALDPTQPLMGCCVSPVQTDRNLGSAVPGEGMSQFLRAQDPVGLKGEMQPSGLSHPQDIGKVRVQERLPAAQLDSGKTERESLIDDRGKKRWVQVGVRPVGSLEPGGNPAMPAA